MMFIVRDTSLKLSLTHAGTSGMTCRCAQFHSNRCARCVHTDAVSPQHLTTFCNFKCSVAKRFRSEIQSTKAFGMHSAPCTTSSLWNNMIACTDRGVCVGHDSPPSTMSRHGQLQHHHGKEQDLGRTGRGNSMHRARILHAAGLYEYWQLPRAHGRPQ